MRRLSVLSIAVILSMVLSLAVVLPVNAGQNGEKVRVLVQFAPGQKGNVERALNGVGAEYHYAFDDLNTFAVTVPAQALAGLERNPNVVLIEEDAPRFPISIMPSSAPAPDLVDLPVQVVPYGVDMVQARDVWDVDRNGVVDSGAPTGSNRKICIIDSGFYTEHEDLQGVTVAGYAGNLPWNVDGSGHGTHVSGTIAAMNNALGVVGVTPGTVSVYMVRVFGDDGLWAYSSTLVDATNRCKSAGANIISMSLGGSKSVRTEITAFANLYTAGILSIAAAGNEGTSALNYPAGYASVVSVAAIDATKTVADFSQFNSDVELAAPGVGVLSTVPYLDVTSLTADSVTYPAAHIEFSPRVPASGALAHGGLCDSVGAWAGKVVLCERGVIDFYTKVHNVELGGGVAAAIYNNVPGGFLGTLGENTSAIIGISLSQEDGQYLVVNKLGSVASVSSTYTAPASSYEYYDGTSMATPHASAVAALVWSAKPTATNAEIRAVLQSTAQDLGTAGRDVYYGYGLVQAKAAITALVGGGGGEEDVPMSVADLSATKSVKKTSWKATVTITVKDVTGAIVPGAKVDGTMNSTVVTCTTGTAGTCSVSASFATSVTSVTYTVTNLTAAGYIYNPAGNLETSIVIAK